MTELQATAGATRVHSKTHWTWPRWAGVLLFILVVIQNAWVCDDAFITFRMIDNWISGYGLTWNTTERVCTSTHPLWMLIHAPFFLLSSQVYYVTIALCIAATLATALLLAYRIAPSAAGALAGMIILAFSKAFVDFSTSGLENPLTHLIAAAFFWIYVSEPLSPRRFLWLSICLGLAMLNRMDTVLLYLLPMAYALVKLRDLRCLRSLALGMLPFVAWEMFSVFYYGFLFPNTAYAKLNTGIDTGALARQGLLYLQDACTRDPLTVVVIALGAAAGFTSKDNRLRCAAGGVLLYVAYVIRIGGDFMAGRFLAAPLLVGTMILISSSRFAGRWIPCSAALVAVALGLCATKPTIVTWPGPADPQAKVEPSGIADERSFYFQASGLLNAGRNSEMPAANVRQLGREYSQKKEKVAIVNCVGWTGYYSGPGVHLLDRVALGDPLLARLPALERGGGWRIGHFWRALPAGYFDTLAQGRNLLADPDLNNYYAQLSLVIRGPLFDLARLREIWNLNTGKYDHFLRAYSEAPIEHVSLEDIVGQAPQPDGPPPSYHPRKFSHAGIQVDLPSTSKLPCLRLGIMDDVECLVQFCKGETGLAASTVFPARNPQHGPFAVLVRVAPQAIESGYDNVRIYPVADWGSGLHVLWFLSPGSK